MCVHEVGVVGLTAARFAIQDEALWGAGVYGSYIWCDGVSLSLLSSLGRMYGVRVFPLNVYL